MLLRRIALILMILSITVAPAFCEDGASDGQGVRLTPIVLAVREAQDAVVNISTERIVERSYMFGGSLFEQFFRAPPIPRSEKQTSLGSGVLIDDNNHVLTNAHVILRASVISVKTSDGKVYEGKLIGWDIESDIAVVEVISDRRLPHAKIGTAKDLMIGESVIAIGNPYGYSQTVTTGVVSALGRDLDVGSAEGGQGETLYDLIQTDAAINPGNSGGPLINILGKVIGINTAILGSAEGMGFAIPIDRSMRVVEDLINYGEVHTPWLGICTETLEPSRERSSCKAADIKTNVVVTFVFATGPAKGIVQVGDIIGSIGGSEVSSAQEFRAMLKDKKTTDKIEIGLERDGDSRTVQVHARRFPLKEAQALCYEWLGFSVDEVRTRQRTRFGAESASYVIVSELKKKGAAHRAGLQMGDLLSQIDGRALSNISDFQRAMMFSGGRSSIYVELHRGRHILRGTIP
ncbi:trypsin-like peptidase domain-containing protein [bacterium]|nr:trypsin-like peptidase domain-containing protein [bacterium]